MKKVLMTILLTISSLAFATETITLVNTSGPTNGATPVIMTLIDEANRIQNKYKFIMEFKPGGRGVIAFNYMFESPQQRLSVVYPWFAEVVESGPHRLTDFSPLYSIGDSCLVVIANVGDQQQGIDSLEQYRGREVMVGGGGFGNAAHLTALMLADRYGFRVNYIVYKSNFDALMGIVSNTGVNLTIERFVNYQQFKEKNPRLQTLATSCPLRHPDAPAIKTLKEQGINSPYVFNFVVSSSAMQKEKQKELRSILEQATHNLGAAKFRELSDILNPVLNKQTSIKHIEQSIRQVQQLQNQYKDSITSNK
jgi:tripartite-type tricarboxylate transporter receptor subunit TctC